MGMHEVIRKIRKTWTINPNDRIHEGKRGKIDYDRGDNKKIERNWHEYIDDEEDGEYNG